MGGRLGSTEQAAKSLAATRHAPAAIALLQGRGLLLLQDRGLPSLASLVAGEVIRGSWWGHAKGNEIFYTAHFLGNHPDVCSAKLIAGKVTFVHRLLWPALVAVGSSRAPWQLQGLNSEATELLKEVERRGVVRCTGKAAKELERRLLVHSSEVHTETGAHAMELATWAQFVARVALRGPTCTAAAGQKILQEYADALAPGDSSRCRLPWQS